MASNKFSFITKHYDTDGLVYFVTKSIRIYSVGVYTNLNIILNIKVKTKKILYNCI